MLLFWHNNRTHYLEGIIPVVNDGIDGSEDVLLGEGFIKVTVDTSCSREGDDANPALTIIQFEFLRNGVDETPNLLEVIWTDVTRCIHEEDYIRFGSTSLEKRLYFYLFNKWLIYNLSIHLPSEDIWFGVSFTDDAH